MNTWYDKCWSDGKMGNLLSIATICVFLFAVYLCLTILLNAKEFLDFLTLGVALIFFSIMFVVLTLSMIFELKTIKFASLYSGRISGECHYSIKFNINFDEIKTINKYKNNLIFKTVGLFSKETPGFEIELKSGKKYYVSPHLNDIASLRNTLLLGMAEQS